MVRLLLVACLIIAGCSSTNNGLRNNGLVTVTGEGRTFEEAKNNGFTRAVEIAVGAVLLTETQVKNDKLVKDEIIKHSAGYVEDFKIINRTMTAKGTQLEMEVRVKSSKIAERVLGTQKSQTNFQGNQVKAQYDSYLKDRKTGDALLTKVLAGYPSQALQVKQRGNAEFRLTKARDMVIIIPYDYRWNYNYLVALKEALELTHDGQSYGYNQDVIRVQSKNPKDWVGSTASYYFNDRIRATKIVNAFLGQVVVNAYVKDAKGNVIFEGCENVIHHGLYEVFPFTINGNEAITWDSVQIQVRQASPNYWKLDQAANIELSISIGACYNYIQ